MVPLSPSGGRSHRDGSMSGERGDARPDQSRRRPHLVRFGLETVLRLYDDIELVGQAESGTDAVGLCDTTQPNVMQMDLVMPSSDGATAMREILRRCTASRRRRLRAKPYRSRAPGARLARGRPLQHGDSRAPCGQPLRRQEPRQQQHHQARRFQPHRGRHYPRASGPHLSVG